MLCCQRKAPHLFRSQMAIEASASAKVNLTLHVTGQTPDGYHLIDSLVVFANVRDRLYLSATTDMSLDVTGPFAQGVPADNRNLVWRAAELAGWTGHILLEKNLPHGAGIGGGSSDAAAVLRHFEFPEFATWLGADVQVCLWPGPQRMRRIGDWLDRLQGIPTCHMVLVNPGIHVSTPRVFNALATKKNPPMEIMPDFVGYGDFVDWLREQRNDLQSAAISVAPAISEALMSLKDADLARMSGSGSTCFGLFPDAASAAIASERVASEHPDWWVVPTQTLEPPVN